MNPKLTVTSVVGLTQFMTSRGHVTLEVKLTYFMTPMLNLTFDLDLDLKVKHLTWYVTTNVQAAP